VHNATYFDSLVGSVTRVVRHSYYPGKEEAIELCLEEVEDLLAAGRITAEQLTTLRELLTSEESSCLMEGVLREREHPEELSVGDRIAIDCQGIGSQASFTAGVLQGLLGSFGQGEFVALGGTSCGGLSALLAWDGLLRGDPARAVDQLERFWREYSANSIVEAVFNHSAQMLLHLRSLVPHGGLSPYGLASPGLDHWQRMLEGRIDFAEDRALASRRGAPGFVAGSMDLHGTVELLHGSEITAEAVMAAAAVAYGCPAAGVESRAHARGSRLPIDPIRALTRFRPTELWIIQINRAGRRGPYPLTGELGASDIGTGNLILEQELRFLGKINELIERGTLIDNRYRHIEVHRIVMDHDLDDASRLDRSPAFITRMMSYGRERAEQFLEKRMSGPATRPPPHLVLG
jgi:NTE family protein